MEKPPQEPAAPQTVQCRVCRKQIPRSAAHSAEGSEYTLYFCGLDCYHKWEKGSEASRDDDRGVS